MNFPRSENARHLSSERHEVPHGNEVLLQQVRRHAAGSWLERRGIQACLMVAPGHRLLLEQRSIGDAFTQAVPTRQFRDCPDRVLLEVVVQTAWYQPVWLGHRFAGRGPGDRSERSSSPIILATRSRSRSCASSTASPARRGTSGSTVICVTGRPGSRSTTRILGTCGRSTEFSSVPNR